MGSEMGEISGKRKGVSASTLVAALGVLTPAAYLIGLSFYQGTLSAYGLDYESFPISGPDVYVTAYYAFGHFLLAMGVFLAGPFKSVFQPPGIYWTVGIFAAFLFFLCWMLRKRESKAWFNKLKSWPFVTYLATYLYWKNNACTRAIVLAIVSSYLFVLMLTLVPILAVMWWLFPLAAFHKAQQIENEKIINFQKHGCYVREKQPWSNCFSLYDAEGKEVATGLLIVVGEKRAAFFLRDEMVVVDMPEGYTMKRQYSKGNPVP